MTEPDRVYQEQDAKGNPVSEHEVENLARCLLPHIRDFFGT